MGVVSIGVSRESKNCENFFWSLWWHFRESLHLRKFPAIRYDLSNGQSVVAVPSDLCMVAVYNRVLIACDDSPL